MNFNNIYLILAVVSLSNFANGDEYCYATDVERTQNGQFSTKSAYQIVKGSSAGSQYLVPSNVYIKLINN